MAAEEVKNLQYLSFAAVLHRTHLHSWYGADERLSEFRELFEAKASLCFPADSASTFDGYDAVLRMEPPEPPMAGH